ncbi:MAG: peptidase family protein [Ilumatobacteraceae bacterium]|nr:peptidase family protein [Ilumatobacteraceae bacterium]MCU1386936.1 peptidase family protein [Ilumatobacteraceae bacterium]
MAKTWAGCVPVVMALLLVACGGDSGNKTTPTTLGSGTPIASGQTPASTLPLADSAETGVAIDPSLPDATVPADLGDPAAKSGSTTTTVAAIAPVTTAAPVATPTTVVTGVPASLPIPIPAPVDSRGEEPVIKLGTIEIPKLGLSTTLYDGIRLTTLDRGPGHWPGTAMPGQTGNVVVAGHRVSHDKPFRNIDKLAVGDQVIFTTPDGRFVYDVTSTEIVDPTAVRIIDQTTDKTATLFACHPPGSVSQRIVVHLALEA